MLTVCYGMPVLATASWFQQPQGRKDAVQPFDKVVTPDAVSSKGFISVHKVEGRYLFEIPDSIIGRDLFAVNRIVTSPQDWRNPFSGLCSYGNDWIGQTMFRFNRETGDKIVLQVISVSERTDTTEEGIYAALQQNNAAPAYAVFPVKAYGKTNNSSVIDVTDFLNTDNPVFGYMAELRMIAMPGVLAPDRSYITRIQAFPMNIEIGSIRTYNAGNTALTGEYNSSLVLLPKQPMRSRAFDNRVGYLAAITTEYKQLYANGSVHNNANIWRWRLEPKPEDLDKYYSGQLVEPIKPIVFYIDPATPAKWVPFLIAGVNDWQKALEKAGFKNAVMARTVDPGDTAFNMNDARHNVIVYKAAAIANATGHSLQDPRSGEIIESHIQWYHSVMEVLYKWYFTQAGAIDTAAQHPQLSDELMGQLIRFVSSHEVGHALGLRHNWGASGLVPVDSLRNKRWVETHGHTPSIMDYARFNYVAQPEDGITHAGIFPRIGDYDEWAVEWGYKLLPPDTDAAAEKAILNKWIIGKLAQSNRYTFGIGDDPSAKYPANQREDLGDDAVKAGDYGIRNLQYIHSHLAQWVQQPGESYNRLEDMYKALVAQYEWYIKHATACIGGVYFTPKTSEQPGAVFRPFSAKQQRAAMIFLSRQLFSTPQWLYDSAICRNTNTDFSMVETIQRNTIKKLLDVSLFRKLRSREVENGIEAYTTNDLLADITSAIFSELSTGKEISANRRFLQNACINEIAALLAAKDSFRYLDVLPLLKARAAGLALRVKSALALYSTPLQKAHLEQMLRKLQLMNTK